MYTSSDKTKIYNSSYLVILIFMVLFFLTSTKELIANSDIDWMTNLPRTQIHVLEWENSKKVAVCFVLNVEEWGFDKGPNFMVDMVGRKPDFVNEAFRQYAINSGITRVGKIFNEQEVPLSIALNAQFPKKHPAIWKTFRSLVPKAPIIAHGMNNTTDLLPLDSDQNDQEAYIQKTLDLIQQQTGIRPNGWLSPKVYANGATFEALTTEKIAYSLDAMDSDALSYIKTKNGPLILIPFPSVTIDIGQFFQRLKQPTDIEKMWIDYVTELAREAESHFTDEAVVVAIGIHPLVVGTPDGAAALARVLQNFKKQNLVWLTDVSAIFETASSFIKKEI